MGMSEDEVRNLAGGILGFLDKSNAYVRTKDFTSGAGQITTFIMLDGELGHGNIFKSPKKPDGWLLPYISSSPAIILETKEEDESIYKQKWVNELIGNMDIVMKKYPNVIGILYNYKDIRVFKNHDEITNSCSSVIENYSYYLNLFDDIKLDKEHIYELTKKINDCLHTEFGIKNLYHRMIFTACALVAERYGARLTNLKGMDYSTFHTSIHSTLAKSLASDKKQNSKLDVLLDEFSKIQMSFPSSQEAIDNFITWVKEISDCINSSKWRGEDVMGIFFNEFNRYKAKSDAGQVFTPEHITDFMYKILEVNIDDRILDAACGSGGFLVKSMANMIDEAGGEKTNKAKDIKTKQLFGIEKDSEIYALACANMLIHKDGKTNLEQLDSRSKEAADWMTSKEITKVLMNPPFERKYGCMDIVKNVLDSVGKREIVKKIDGVDTRIEEKRHILCAFVLPEMKLEKEISKARKILKNHTLLKIIKMPEDLFAGTGITTSIFIFKTSVPQKDKEIFTCYMEDDGLATVKNKGRHDVKNKWNAIEKYWVDVVLKQSGDKTCEWINPNEHLSYQKPSKPFVIKDVDFIKTTMEYLMFDKKIDKKEFEKAIVEKVLYSGDETK